MEQFNTYTVSEEEDGERLDKLLTFVVQGRSRSFLQKLFKEQRVLVFGKPVKASYRVGSGDVICFSIPEKILPDILPEDIPLDILYEDEDVLVVNKPKNMVVHPAPGHYSGTLVNAVMYHCGSSLSGINGVLRPGIVHRIDKDTTGSVIICKNDNAHQSIAEQLKEHSIARRYRAIVYGTIREDDLTINAPVGRDPKDRKKMAVTPDGKSAVTHVHVLQRYRDYTYVECRLETGRTHQIRVHMASIGHPLAGDPLYGKGTGQETMGLHAWRLSLQEPFGPDRIEITAERPGWAAFYKGEPCTHIFGKPFVKN